MRPGIEKQFQLTIVVVGFFTTLQVLITAQWTRSMALRIGVTLAIAVACLIRYWWVILTLTWPARWFRTLLLLLVWTSLPLTAAFVGNAMQWAGALVGLSTLGCMTEIYNYLTQQWRVGSPEMIASLKLDHIAGIAASAAAAVVIVGAMALLSSWLDVIILVLVIADWTRLIAMIERHRRLSPGGMQR